MSTFTPFEMERWQSTWEHRVRINLSESGVHPLSTRELVELSGEGDSASFLDLRQGYGQSNGSDGLRTRIAALYPGANPDSVVVTVGGAEANFAAVWSLLGENRRWAVVLPTYMQVPGLVTGFEGHVIPVHLRESDGWQPDPDEVERAFSEGAQLLLVTNPNNPTGAVLDPERRQAILASAERRGAWIVADEVYAGAEFEGPVTESFYGLSDRVVATNSLSKAYGLPGLRIGWTVSDPALAEQIWSRTDYTTITPATLSDHLATIALDGPVRARILDRTRQIVRSNRELVDDWVASQGDRFRFRPPSAGAIAFLWYASDTPSREVAERLRVEEDVLVVPGGHFGMEGYLRIGFGIPAAELQEGLERITRLFDRL